MKGAADEIGARVRRRREALGLTRAELAGLSGVSEDALGLIERGISVPRIGNLLRLAEALRVPAATLLEGRPRPAAPRSAALDRLLGYLSRRPESEVRMVHDIARGVLERRGRRRRSGDSRI